MDPCVNRSRIENNDFLKRSIIRIRCHIPNLLDHIQTINHLTKDGVLAIQMGSSSKRDKELATICSWTTVGHRHDTRTCVKERIVELILELASPDGFTTATSASRVAALEHETRDDPVEDDTVEFAGVRKASEVLSCLIMVLLSISVRSEECTCLGGLVAEQCDRDIAIVGYHEHSPWLS